MKAAVIVIDMVNDFVSGVFHNPKAQAIIPSVQALLTKARAHHVPVIYCSDAHQADDVEFNVWPIHCLEKTWGADIIDELSPQSEDILFTKRTYSAFFNTPLHDWLQQHEIDTVVLCGVVTSICVAHTAAEAFFHGYRIIVPQETTASTDDATYRQALSDMKTLYRVETPLGTAFFDNASFID